MAAAAAGAGAVAGSARSPMRERFREQVRDDVKAVALDQLAAGGPAALSVNAIAKELGVSGPALYRYFANRDELLAELVVDAYHDFAAALAAANAPDLTPGRRVRALAGAWRGFARAQPHRYQLMFAPPLPGYDAHSEPLVAASQRVMAVALDAYGGEPGGSAGEADPEVLARVVAAWYRLHGFVGLELGGNFDSMGMDADTVFRREVDALVRDRG
jgi:AcrR family transcriptional regulator